MSSKFSNIKSAREIFDSWSLSNEKATNETGIVEQLLQNLSIKYSTLQSAGKDDPPDCLLVIDGAIVGVEVVNLIHFKARKLSAKSRQKGSTEFYAIWTKDSFQKHLEKLVGEKDQKIQTGISNNSAAASCKKFWLVISTAEMTLY